MGLTDRDLVKRNWFNLIKEDKTETPIQIKDSASDFVCEVYVNDNFVKVLYDDIKPIPLTLEILENSGFDYIESDSYHFVNGYFHEHMRITKEQNKNRFTLSHSDNQEFTKIEFVHELQNLFYALTKTELEIKF